MIPVPDNMKVGTIHKTNESGSIIITNYAGSACIHVRFLNTGNKFITRATSIKNGKVLDKKEKYRKRAEEISKSKKCIYLISIEGTKYVKIGWTINIKQRITALQMCNPHKLIISKTFECKSVAEAKKLEKTIHKICDEFRFRGEWFVADEINSFIAFIENKLEEGKP